MRLNSLALAAALLVAAAPAFAADYVQQAGSTLTFATKYQGEVFAGNFPGFTARLSFDPAKLDGSKLDVVIPLAGANSKNPSATTPSRAAISSTSPSSRRRATARPSSAASAATTTPPTAA